MLAQNFNQDMWLREQDHPAINLPRWQQQVDLLNDQYNAKTCAIVQFAHDATQVVCGKSKHDFGLSSGTVFQDDKLSQTLMSHSGVGLIELDSSELSAPLQQFEKILCLQICWPDGMLFGCILLCDPTLSQQGHSLSAVTDSIKALIQAELKHVYLMRQIQMLSVQDELTCMLNPYGFGLMAPRQLSLSRRFGSHAGIVVVEEVPSPGQHIARLSESQKLRLLARIITASLREADVSARIDNQFVILAFVDNHANLNTLVARLNKQMAKEAPELKIAMGQSFFTPDAQISLKPMQSLAIKDLQQNIAKMSAKTR